MIGDQLSSINQNQVTASVNSVVPQKITLDQIASTLLKENFILTALEFYTELSENGRDLPRLRDYFSNPANFEQITTTSTTSGGNHFSSNSNSYSTSSLNPNNIGYYGAGNNINNNNSGGYPLHKASSIQTFDSLDLTRYSDDVDQTKQQDDKIVVLEFELRKAKETINQLRTTLTLATCTHEKETTITTTTTNNDTKKQTDDADNTTISKYSTNVNNNTKTNQTLNEYESSANDDLLTLTNGTALMPYDKNAINFLVNQYLLEQNYKMTSVTFSEENDAQDLEDWDIIGVNRSQPPNLCQIYKLYLNRSLINQQSSASIDTKKSEEVEESKRRSFVDTSSQCDLKTETKETNTLTIECKDTSTTVNIDKEIFDNQRMQINSLLEKQEILHKSIATLETEIKVMTSEREVNLKKIDLL
jgi:hypothetical protein